MANWRDEEEKRRNKKAQEYYNRYSAEADSGLNWDAYDKSMSNLRNTSQNTVNYLDSKIRGEYAPKLVQDSMNAYANIPDQAKGLLHAYTDKYKSGQEKTVASAANLANEISKKSGLVGQDLSKAIKNYENISDYNKDIKAGKGAQYLNDSEKSEYSKAKLDLLNPEQQDFLNDYALKYSAKNKLFFDPVKVGKDEGALGLVTGAKSTIDLFKIKGEAQKRFGWTPEETDSYLEYARRIQNERDQESLNAGIQIDPESDNKLKQAARNTAVALSNPQAAILTGGEMVKNWFGKSQLGYDPNSPFNRAYNYKNEAQAQVSQNAIGDDHKVGQFAYNALMATADSAEQIAMFGGLGENATLLPFFTGSYASKYQEAKQRGLTDKEADKEGIMAGAIEAVTEKVSLDHLWNMATKKGLKITKKALGEWFAQTFIEGSEEMASDLLNRVADYLVAGKSGKTEMQYSIDGYMAEGMSEEEAKSKAEEDFWTNLLLDGLAGSISGSIMGGGAIVANNARTNSMRKGISENMSNQDDNARAEEYSKNPVKFLADAISEDTEERKQSKAELNAIAEKEARGEKLSTQDKFTISQALENAQLTQKEYDSYYNDVLENKTSNITEEDARKQLIDASKAGDVKELGRVYQEMQKSSFAEDAEEILNEFSGMAQNNGISKEAFEAVKMGAEEAYQAGLNNESISQDATIEAQIANNEGQIQAKIEDAKSLKEKLAEIDDPKARVEMLRQANTEIEAAIDAAREGKNFEDIQTKAINNTEAKEVFDSVKTTEVKKEATKILDKALTLKNKGTGSFTDIRTTDKTKVDTSAISQIAKYTGLDFVLRDKTFLTDKNGNQVIDQRTGKPIEVRGAFETENSTIYLTTDDMAQVFHELGEFADLYASEEYKRFCHYAEKTIRQSLGDEEFERILNDYHQTYIQAPGHENQTLEMSKGEMINDYIVSLMGSHGTNAIFAEALVEDMGYSKAKAFGVKFINAINKVLNSIMKVVKGSNLSTYQKDMINKNITQQKLDMQLFIEALDAARSNYQSTEVGQEINTDIEVQSSLTTVVESLGMNLRMEGGYAKIFDDNGKEIKNFTPTMIRNTPIGAVINSAVDNKFISEEDSKKQYKFLSSLFNQIIKIGDIDMVWAVNSNLGFQRAKDGDYASDMKSTFSPLVKNAEKQYGTSFDATTICLKTQAIVDAMSGVMMQREKGLTREQVVDIVFNEVHKAGEPVPCPVCYVFSRWVGLGGLFDKINNLQNKYKDISNIDIRQRLDDLDLEISKKESELESTLGESFQKLDKSKKKEKVKNAVEKAVRAEYEELESRDWAARFDKSKALSSEEKARRDKLADYIDMLDERTWFEEVRLNHRYKPVPPDVLFNINAGRKFAEEYPLTWKFRTTKGSGMGKATIPYSDHKLGQMIRGVGSPSTVGTPKLGDLSSDPFLFQKNKGVVSKVTDGNLTPMGKRLLNSAINKMRNQNLLGGQRFQSTSDFRFEYALDYLLAFYDIQAIGGKTQQYTKVPESVDLIASCNGEMNCSLMPLAMGYVADKEGNPIRDKDGRIQLRFSTVTGMHPKDAENLSNTYDNVQPIIVAVNNVHLRACLAEDWLTMVIPYHASGNTEGRYQSMMKTLEEEVASRTDYSPYQNDLSYKKVSPEQAQARKIRKAIVTANLANPSKSDMEFMNNHPALKSLWERFYVEGVDADCYHVKLTSEQSEQIMPYEFWDKSLTIEDADKNSELFAEYCEMLGYHPRFSGHDNRDGYSQEFDFLHNPDGSINPGYWKMLIDRPMYNRDGTYHEPKPINVTNFTFDFTAREDGTTEVKLPTSGEIVAPSRVNDRSKTMSIVEASIKRIEEGEATEYSLSVDSEGNKLTKEQEKYFEKSQVRDEDGNLRIVYHGTEEDFTVFDRTKGRTNMDINGFFFSPYEEDAGGYGGKVKAYYLNITNPCSEGVAFKALNMFKGQNNAGVKAREYLESKGYDGVYNGYDEYIAFYPEQIKLIDNQKPTENPDIRYSIEVYKNVEYARIDNAPENFDSMEFNQKMRYATEAVKNLFDRDGYIEDKRGSRIYLHHNGASHYGFDTRRQYTDEIYDAKYKAAPYLSDIMKASRYIGTDVKPSKHKEAKYGISTYRTIFRIGNSWYTGVINVFNRENRREFYDITKIDTIMHTDVISLMETLDGYDSAYETMIEHYKEVDKTKNYDNKNFGSDNIKYALKVDDVWFDMMAEEETPETEVFKATGSILEEGMKNLKNQPVSMTAIRKIAKDIVNSANSSYSATDLAEKIKLVFAYCQEGSKVDYNEMMQIMNEVARPVVEQTVDQGEARAYKKFKDQFKGEKIQLTDAQLEVVRNQYGTIEAYKKFVGNIAIGTKGKPLDEHLWEDIAKLSQGVLTGREQEDDRPKALADAFETLKPVPSNDWGADQESAAKDIAMRIVEDYFALAGEKTAKDKMREKEKAYRQSVRDRYNAKYTEYKNKYKARNREFHQNFKKKESVKKQVEIQARKIWNKLINNTEKQHVPSSMKEALADLMGALDFVEPLITRTEDGKYKIKMVNYIVKNGDNTEIVWDEITANTREKALEEYYKKLNAGEGSKNQKSWADKLSKLKDLFGDATDTETDNAIAQLLDPEMADRLKEVIARNSYQLSINNASAEDLEVVHDALKNINLAIEMQNQLFTVNAELDATAQDTLDNAANKKLKMHSAIYNKMMRTLNIDMATPDTFFKAQGKGGNTIYKALLGGLNTRIKDIKAAGEYMNEAMKDIDKKLVKEWTGDSAKIYTFNVLDGELRLTAAQIMGLYVTNKRQQSLSHFAGGIKAGQIKHKGKDIGRNQAVHVTEEDLNKIFSVLSDKQKNLADKMQQFLANDCSKWGNEASLKMYDIEKFLDPNYYPLRVDKGSVDAKESDTRRDMLNGIERSGFTKQVKPDSKNPIVIDDIFDVFTNHVQDMAAYHAYAPAIKDALRWFNYRQVNEHDGWRDYITVKDAINTNLGRVDKAGTEYFTKLVKDINGMERSGEISTVFDSLVGNYKAAAVGGNARVIIQQPVAFVRAWKLVDMKNLLKAMPRAMSHKNEMERIKSLSPLAWYKSQGYYETSLGKSMKEMVTGISTLKDRIVEKSMALAGAADDITWATLYNAAELQIDKKGLSEEEYRDKVNDLFDRIISETQVVDATLFKSQFMRATGSMTKLRTAFMAEPIKSYNMALESIMDDYNKHGNNVFKWKATRKALAVLVVTDIVTSMAQSIIDAMRYKEEDDEYLEKWLEYLKKNMLDNLNPLNKIPIVKDLTNQVAALITGESQYGSTSGQSMDYASISAIFKALDTAKKQITGNYKKTDYAAYMDYAKALSYTTGVPAYNISRDFASFYNLFAKDEARLVKEIEKPNDKYTRILDMIDRDKPEEEIQALVDKAMSKNGTINDFESQLESRYKSEYLAAYEEDDQKTMDEVYDKALTGFRAVGLSTLDAEREIESWTEEKIGYSILDDAIESGIDLDEALSMVREAKDDDKIAKHILKNYEATINYNRSRGIDSNIESDVDKVIRTISGQSYDQAISEYHQQLQEAEEKKAAKEALDASKEALRNAIDMGSSDYKSRVEDMVSKGAEYSQVKSYLTSEYKEEVLNALQSGDTQKATMLMSKIATIKAYCDQKSNAKIAKKYNGDYYQYEMDHIKKWSED